MDQNTFNLDNTVWQQLIGEPPHHYDAFCKYRDLGPQARTTQKIADLIGRSVNTIRAWATKWRWSVRCRAYDHYIQEQARFKNEESIAQMNAKHIQYSLQLQNMVVKHMAYYIKKMSPGIDDATGKEREVGPDNIFLTPIDMIRMLEAAAKIERTARGEPTEFWGKAAQISQEDKETLEAIMGISPRSQIGGKLIKKIRAARGDEKKKIIQDFMNAVQTLDGIQKMSTSKTGKPYSGYSAYSDNDKAVEARTHYEADEEFNEYDESYKSETETETEYRENPEDERRRRGVDKQRGEKGWVQPGDERYVVDDSILPDEKNGHSGNGVDG